MKRAIKRISPYREGADFLRFVCTGDFLDENEAKFPTQEEVERDYSY